jgi:hypothetical protein
MKKWKSLLFVCGLGLMSTLFAGNRHIHPEDGTKQAQGVAAKAMMPGFCEIELINSSFDNVSVYGRFDDGSSMIPFNIYSFEGPHYVSLFYYNYCHRDMYLDIITFSGYHIYSGYTSVDSTVRLVPYGTPLTGKSGVKAEVRAK